jgi:hypothetical protein
MHLEFDCVWTEQTIREGAQRGRRMAMLDRESECMHAHATMSRPSVGRREELARGSLHVWMGVGGTHGDTHDVHNARAARRRGECEGAGGARQRTEACACVDWGFVV